MGYSIINYGTFCPNHPTNKLGGNKKKSKFKVGDYYYPATETEPSIITPEKIEGRDFIGICVIPDGVVGEDAVFIYTGYDYYDMLNFKQQGAYVYPDYVFGSGITYDLHYEEQVLTKGFVKIPPKTYNKIVVQDVENPDNYTLMEVRRVGDEPDNGYFGAYIPINGEWNENAKDYQKVVTDENLWKSVPDLILALSAASDKKYAELLNSNLTITGSEYYNHFHSPNYSNDYFYLWSNEKYDCLDVTTYYIMAKMLLYKDLWTEDIIRYIGAVDSSFWDAGILYSDISAYLTIPARYWAVNFDSGYIGVVGNTSTLNIMNIDSEGNISSVQRRDCLIQNRMPELALEAVNSPKYSIKFIKLWAEAMILNINELDEDIIGFEIKLDSEAIPSDYKISMYTVTPNDPAAGNKNIRTQIYSQLISGTTVTMYFDDLTDIPKPQWVTLLCRKSGISELNYLNVDVHHIQAITKDGKRVECYPCTFKNAGIKINWDLSNEIFDKLYLTEKFFPDSNFRAALAEILEINEGDEITKEMIAATTTLDISGKEIANLTGIEHFTALTRLDCDHNQLTSLDVSNNAALEWLYCYNNDLTSLDVSKNAALTRLYCNFNQLTELDVSKNTALIRLHCSDNQLTELDVSNNNVLVHLYCYGNRLTALDVSKNTALKELLCYGNQLTELDISNNTILESLYCSSNLLTSLNILSNKLNFLNCTINIISGEGMTTLVESLPQVTNGRFYAVSNINDRNTITQEQIDIAKAKGWTVYVNGRTRSPLIGVERFDEEELRKQEEEERFNRN